MGIMLKAKMMKMIFRMTDKVRALAMVIRSIRGQQKIQPSTVKMMRILSEGSA